MKKKYMLCFAYWVFGLNLINWGGTAIAAPYFDAQQQGRAVVNTTIEVYPNPASSIVKITWADKHVEGQKLKLFNLVGTCVLELQVRNGEQLDIKSLLKGVYVMQFENGISLKFIKK